MLQILLQVYQQAQTSDSTYQKEKSNYMSVLSKLAQVRAALLPSLGLESTWNKPTSGAVNHDSTLTTSLSLQQTLFDWSKLKKYQGVTFIIKSAAATYGAAAEDLVMRTATAYFTVLASQEQLRYAEANKKQLYRSLQVAEQRHKVGMDAITSVYEARSKYDAATVDYIDKENQLATHKEELSKITGQFYLSLAILKENFPLVKPSPANIDTWTKKAVQQNLKLLAARYEALAKKENIKVQSAQHLPTLNLNGNYNHYNRKNNELKDGHNGSSIGITLAIPLFKGGSYTAQTKQAEYDYQGAIAVMDNTHRTIVANVRKAYLDVLAAISKIEADLQAIKSAKASLASNEAGYKVGTKTIVDVLAAQTNLYKMQQAYVSDRFNYIINTFKLKEAAGILSVNDIKQVNHWLTNVPHNDRHSTAQYHTTDNLSKSQSINTKNDFNGVEEVNNARINTHSTETNVL
jgi:outer membrane protein